MARRSRAEREGTEDEYGLLDAQLLAPLAALGEEAEHLDNAGRLIIHGPTCAKSKIQPVPIFLN